MATIGFIVCLLIVIVTGAGGLLMIVGNLMVSGKLKGEGTMGLVLMCAAAYALYEVCSSAPFQVILK